MKRHTGINVKEVGKTILISDRIDFRVNKLTRHKKEHYIAVK